MWAAIMRQTMPQAARSLGAGTMQSGRSIYRQIFAVAALPAVGLSVVLLTILLVFYLNLPSPTASIVVSTAAGLAAVVLGVYLAWREIVARRQLAEAVEDSQRKQNDALALVAHQLRNPLSAITNAVDVLNLLGGTDEASEEIQQIINRQIALMSRLVNDLLDCTRVGHGKLELHRARLDLANCCAAPSPKAADALHAGDREHRSGAARRTGLGAWAMPPDWRRSWAI